MVLGVHSGIARMIIARHAGSTGIEAGQILPQRTLQKLRSMINSLCVAYVIMCDEDYTFNFLKRTLTTWCLGGLSKWDDFLLIGNSCQRATSMLLHIGDSSTPS